MRAQRFQRTVLVPIDGVDFAPYVEILLRPAGGSTIADRVVVVTDADPSAVPATARRILKPRQQAGRRRESSMSLPMPVTWK